MSGSKRNAMKKTAILVSSVALSACLFGCSQAEQPQNTQAAQEQSDELSEVHEYVKSDIVNDFLDGFDALSNNMPTDMDASFEPYLEATEGFYDDCVALALEEEENIPESCRQIHAEFALAAEKAAQADWLIRDAAESSGSDRATSMLSASELITEASESLLNASEMINGASGE